MKKLVIILLVALPLLSVAQTAPPIVMGSKLYEFKNGIRPDSAIFLPRKDTTASDPTMIAPGMMLWRPADQSFYGRDSTKWGKFVLTGTLSDYVPTTRSINTTSPLSGGGNLSADRTLSIANAQADGENKGAATFRSDHFDDDGLGAISLDTINGPYYTKTQSIAGFIHNQNAAAQTGNFWISGEGRINNTLRIATSNTAAAPLHVGTLPSYASLSAVFEGNVQTIAATANNQATTLGQIKDSLNTKWSKTGDAVSSGQFLGSTNSAAVVIKTNNDTAILANASKQVFVDTTLTMGDYVYDRKAIPGDPPHVFEVTSSGNTNYLAQFTNFSATTGLANIHVRKARGTKEAPSAVQYGDALASFGFRGYGTNNFGPSSGAFIWFARNNFTDSLHGTECQIQTTAVGANAWYGRTYAFIFGADGSFTIPRAVTAAGDNNVATLSSLTDYANSWLQFNNSNATRRGYIGMFGNTNQLTINADAGSTGTPTVRITNRLLVNTSTDNGSGLMVGGSISAPIATITGSTTLTATQSTVLVNNSGSVTITLPAASGCSGRIYVIKKVSAASNDVVIDPNASELIDGTSTSKTLTLQWSSVIIQSNGTSWFVLGSHAAATTL